MTDMPSAPLSLPRGGLLIPCGQGAIQLGAPPETIKDSMGLSCGVPDTFVLPQFMFFIAAGVSLAELEFPIYYNFFLKRRKTRVVCSQEQRRRLLVVLQEALFGPLQLDYSAEYVAGSATPGYPDLAAELAYFRQFPFADGLRAIQMEDVVEFHCFDDQGWVALGELRIHLEQQHALEVWEQDRLLARVERDQPLAPLHEEPLNRDKVFYPPLFGVTALGTGHGFDPDANTSGLILWINRRGIIVDPLVNASNNLRQLGVNPKLIDSVILTHCHADHDAGTLQRIMQEGRIRLYTTPTIFESFLRKSAALTGIEESRLRQVIIFCPVRIGEPVNINGGEFCFAYTLHSIPTISIQIRFLGRGVIYSSDTMNDRGAIEQIHQKGVLSQQRRDFLLDFPWHLDLIFHEAGVPPLHTPISFLAQLPEDVRQRLYLVHVSPQSVPPGSGLRIAPAGLNNTVEIEVEPFYFDEAMEIISVLLNIDLFQAISLHKAREFLSIARKERFSAGSFIFRQGESSKAFHIIINGRVDIIEDGCLLTCYSDSDYFGEKSLFLNEPRTASAQAVTEVNLLTIEGGQMLQFIRGAEMELTLRNLALQQNRALREALALNPVFSCMTPTQQTHLHKIVEELPQIFTPGQALIREDSLTDDSYFIKSGRIEVSRRGVHAAYLKAGDLFGLAAAFSEQPLAHYSFSVSENARLIRIPNQALKAFLVHNPGIYVKLFFHEY
jgi:CRP-like cAMP-binding protein/phosphoribosyl 1,2-cyclic phosphodiesterase